MVHSPLIDKLKSFYEPYVLFIVSVGYVVGELGHYLIGVTTKYTARDLEYGDIGCLFNSTTLGVTDIPAECYTANSSDSCQALAVNGSTYCEWDRNGLGIDYQVIAGPAFILVFTFMGVILGIAADRFNRARILSVCSIIFSVAIILTGAVKEYWHLVLLRILLAAGESACNPMATGILSDIFPEEKRGLVMAIFNWGIYGGYGIAFPVGRYVTEMNAWGLGWRVPYYGAGVVSLIIAVLMTVSLREPERKAIGEESTKQAGEPEVPTWKVLLQPRIVLLCIAASIRHCGGMTFAYNCDLYYREYFPDYDLGWWLFAVTIVIGSIGVVVGGVVSDKILISTPFAFCSVYLSPVGAMVTLGISYFFAEMWFGIVFAILVEITPLACRSTAVGVFLFVMNNVGGNLPILVEPVSKAIGYRESLYIFYAGFYLLSSVLFFFTMFLMDGPKRAPRDTGHDNPAATLEMVANGHGARTLRV
ncbi:hypothetical protein FOCC_FOCC006616 [Frankliniella occidentalis]|nr:hypothetical protein FOCC_FOCC006616 [Frankliniella occidentalis]